MSQQLWASPAASGVGATLDAGVGVGIALGGQAGAREGGGRTAGERTWAVAGGGQRGLAEGARTRIGMWHAGRRWVRDSREWRALGEWRRGRERGQAGAR
jgi:hypothetical protein